ncbi:hypothetical protein PsYK624_119030 [Phanerochaete sordida]|uniref:Uncharacterized protein n=1 Tax=Phanerochaete sordida TaxID=48140 RepID=A0A9P3GIH7_9APHY|nr:hypothetical protein PsYK624_119030 [Phanerochaete sordida]
MIQLLRASYQIRHVTLEALAKTFNIRYIDEGLGRFEGQSPWHSLSLQAYDAWWAARNSGPASPPPDGPDDPNEPPILAAYLAAAVLQRQTKAFWAFLNHPGPPEVADHSQISITERWERYAMAKLAAFPEPFRCSALFQRVYAVVAGSTTAVVFGLLPHQLRAMRRSVQRAYQNNGGQTLNDSALEGIGFTAELLLIWLRPIPATLERLDAIPKGVLCPTAESVDGMMGRAKHLALIGALSDILDLNLANPAFERCQSEARSLSKILSERLAKLPQEAQSPADGQAGGAAIDASDPLVQEADG